MMMRRWIMMLGGAVLLSAAKAGAVDLSSLGWMSGDWVASQGGEWTEERWSPPRGGVMLGTNLNGKGGRASGFEFLRIAAEADGTVNYWGSPGGRPAVPFRLVSNSGNQAVFENPKHDFPTRIAYRRNGATLTATISGANGAGQQSWTFRRSR